ncbi:MAG TPA: hypothetical protein VGQ35_08210 [Dongiaceae bacterium]|jgi:hypothetical protein|nr:hypothetical protein [Dongiaceae bacterium]
MTNGSGSKIWIPFRPSRDDLARIAEDVAAIPDLQAALVENHPDVTLRDRVAHQYQIAGGRVTLKVAAQLPEALNGLGLFQPNAEHIGIGRVSTGLGCPHAETDPDFLGLMLAFQTPAGRRVDFLALNDPTAPTDTHPDFMVLLAATVAAAGAKSPFGGGEPGVLVSSGTLVKHLLEKLGAIHGGATAAHVVKQTGRTALSSSAYQTYWTGIVEASGVAGKFVIVPTVADQNPLRSPLAGPRHLTVDWRARQGRGDVTFDLYWIPFIDQDTTSTETLTKAWDEQRQRVGRVAFPKQDANDKDAALWAILAEEMGANAGHWIADRADSIAEPATAFTAARKAAYRKSQDGRGALPEARYAQVFQTGAIDERLAAELRDRRARRVAAGHVSTAP